MLLQFCDKCGRPLSEGCIARGEAVERDGELVCAHCVSSEQAKAAVRAEKARATEPEGPLGHYEKAVWSCESCGIPVTALDLIEGRASRVGGLLKCSRCAPIEDVVERPAPKPAAPRPTPGRSSLPRSKPVFTPPKAAASAPRHSKAAAEHYVEEAHSEQKRPILPIVMFAIVLPMFAISLYYAVTTQVKLNEVMGGQANEPQDKRNRRPQEALLPETNKAPDKSQPENPTPAGSTQPEPAPDRPPQPTEGQKQRPIPNEVMDDLVTVENELAAPIIKQLQSPDLGQVWEGLIAAGSRRLIATRPYVRALLQDKDDQIRALACRVSGMLTDKEALPELKRRMEQDPAEPVRTEARKAYDRLTGEATRELKDLTDRELEDMLRDIKRELERRNGRSD
ncbi:MAG: HEAT repeat domain-containing protein [Planctomycetes bacterium]|nr:HEAT repeat domain-containing protein [Planctomycetota bacterium]